MSYTLDVQGVPDNQTAQDQLAQDPRWHLVLRIIASNTFSRAQRLNNFLCYVCERQLLGRTDEITEHQIGIHVFGRPTDYNPGDDNIVRSSARLLRQRLTQYFHEEGAFETERVVIPRGGYVPVFEMRPEPAAPLASLPLPQEPPRAESSVQEPELETTSFWKRTWFFTGALGLLLLAGVVVVPRLAQSPTDRLWATMFPGGRSTVFLAGDSALVILENMTHHAVGITAYSAGNYVDSTSTLSPETDDEWVRNLGRRRYTSIADLKLASSFSALAGSKNNTLQIKYARDISTDELKNGNLILSGDPQGNPWVSLFDKDLNFRFFMNSNASVHIIRNVHPLAGEQAEYRSSSGDPEHRAYALIALTHSLDGRGHVLLIEGTTMAGLEAAQDFLFSSGDLSRVLRPAVKRDGLHDFEILLESKNIAAQDSGFQVIATRVH
jgi:hypothetical protein